MRRIGLAVVLSVSLILASLAADAQSSGKVYRIGVLINLPPTATPEGAQYWNALIQGLREHGYVEGQNLIIESRFSEGRSERWPALASELVGLKVDLIVVFTTPAALAVKKASNTMPIVFPTANDPVGTGLAVSLARPGGNVTGIAILATELAVKRLALLKEAVPNLGRVAVLWNADNPTHALVWRETEGAPRPLGLTLHYQQVRTAKDFEGAFAAIAERRPDGLLVLDDSLMFQQRKQIIDFTTQKHLPGAFYSRAFTDLGGLMSYGPNRREMFRRGADYVDRILKGAKPADLPIEQPSKFEFVINLKTAKVSRLQTSFAGAPDH